MKHVMWMAALVLVACQPAQEQAPIASNMLDAQVEEAAPANIQFGMDFDAFNIERHEVAPNEYFGGILSGYGLGAATIQAIVDRAQGIFDRSPSTHPIGGAHVRTAKPSSYPLTR